MATFHHQIEVRIDGATAGLLDWVGERESQQIKLTFKSANLPTGPVGVVWKVDWQKKTLSVDMSQLASAMNGLCLAGCLIGAGAALTRCILKARSEDEVWACLDEHAGVAGTSVIGCIIGCISGT
jgi:hypothetical protein